MDEMTQKILDRITALKEMRQKVADDANKKIYAMSATIAEFEAMLPDELKPKIQEVKGEDNGS